MPDAPVLHIDGASHTVVGVAPDGTFVAIQSALDSQAPVVLHSGDGLSWTASGPLPAAMYSQVEAITRFGGGLIAVGWDEQGPGAIWSSPDGATWQRVPTQPALEPDVLERVAASSTTIVVVLGNGAVAGSHDGITWTAASPGEPGGQIVADVTATDLGFVAVGGAGTVAAAWTSVDGWSWRAATFPDDSDANARMLAVAARGRRAVALGAVPGPGEGASDPWSAIGAWVSTDAGATWTRTGTSTRETAPALFPQNPVRLYVLSDGFVVLGMGPADLAIWNSLDGVGWQEARVEGGAGVIGDSLAVTGDVSVIAGRTGGTGAGGDRSVFWIRP
ncbi:MAG: hypothetical protein ACHQ15_07295 [Candidatus Limnocylindrales bacterium]